MHEGGNVYDLRIPMMQLTHQTAKSMGDFVIKRPPPRIRKGLFDLEQDIESFTTRAPLIYQGGGGGGGNDAAASAAAATRKKQRAAKQSDDGDAHDPSAG